MKSYLYLLLCLGMLSCTGPREIGEAHPQTVEASCGQCNLGLTGGGCDLAIRVNGKAYWVDGIGIDDHGDSHAQDGFCATVRKAKVQGTISKGRFQASFFELLPEPEK